METPEDKITIKCDKPMSLNKRTPELPIDGLPESIRNYIESVCEIYHCPREFVTSAVIATASTAVGKKIKIDEGKYKNSLVLWFVLVARSGSNKSYPMKLVADPLRKIDAELYATYKEEHDEWKSIPLKDRNGDEPKCPSIVLDDCTDERRSENLFMNNDTNNDKNSRYKNSGKRGAIGIYPELKGMFDSKNQYQNGGTAGISKLLRLFDCEDIKVDRRNGFTMLIKDPFCNILGDLQTGMLRSTFGSELYMTNGLNQRFLFCVAEDIEYPERSHDHLPREISSQWELTARMLHEGIYHDPYGGHHTLFRSTDGLAHLCEEADELYNEYYNQLQRRKRLAKTDYEASIYSKLQIQVLRYAGVVHALEVAEEKGERNDYYLLHGNTMGYAIRCMQYYEEMAMLVYRRLVDQPESKSTNEMTNAEFIRSFFTRFPKVSQNAFARLTGLSAPYISKVMKQKDG